MILLHRNIGRLAGLLLYSGSLGATEAGKIDFGADIRPILDAKCVACHACYDAPCQLKLDSDAGVPRGASKIRVYNGARLEDIPPTRLGVDAKTPAEWKEKGFFDVFSGSADNPSSLARRMLELGRTGGLSEGQAVPTDITLGLKRKNVCPSPGEFDEYADAHPQEGMPLLVSGLDDREYRLLLSWMEQGADTSGETPPLSDSDLAQIDRWESWLNRSDDRSRLLARYLYEHLFLGHLFFDKTQDPDKRVFYQLVRSRTPPGEVVEPLATARPNDDPGSRFFYRLLPIHDSIVHKTHIPYYFGPDRLDWYRALFEGAEWGDFELPGYGYTHRSNPFLTFAAMPGKARYLFLLEDAEFFVRTFIRGPVCRGQVATDVIRDQFWIMFESPDIELFTRDPDYSRSTIELLGLPGEKSSLLDLGIEWFRYREKRNDYLERKRAHYNDIYPSGPELDHIWQGDGKNPNAFLTVFRHHDSASVERGWIGSPPLTAWVMDYPLFERTVYELVVGFNVFGSVSHQAQTRLYFDLIRNEGETSFLQLLPPESRKAEYDAWYQSSGKIKTAITYHERDLSSPTAIEYAGENHKAELFARLADVVPGLTGSPYPGDACEDGCRDSPTSAETEAAGIVEDLIRRIESAQASDLPVIRWLPEVSFVGIGDTADPESVYTLLRNRRHSNVAFMFGEELRYQEDLDTLTIPRQLIGSYPNLIFRVPSGEVVPFFESLIATKTEEDYRSFLERWAVRRMNRDFWPSFHGFSAAMRQSAPLEAGIYDLNRYLAW